jgi:hypothetical protein
MVAPRRHGARVGVAARHHPRACPYREGAGSPYSATRSSARLADLLTGSLPTAVRVPYAADIVPTRAPDGILRRS